MIAVVEPADLEGVLREMRQSQDGLLNDSVEAHVLESGAGEVCAPRSGRRLCDNFSHDVSDSRPESAREDNERLRRSPESVS